MINQHPVSAAWAQDTFFNLKSGENHKIANNSPTTDATEEISTDLESSELKNHVSLTIFKKL
jgi:hypothetical protein